MRGERSCSGTSGKSNTMVTLCDKIRTKIWLCREQEKRGGRETLILLRKHTEDSIGKVRTETSFGRIQLGMKKDLKKSWFNSSFVLWIGISYSEVQLKTLGWAFIRKSNIENTIGNKFQLCSLYGLRNVLDFLLSIISEAAIICHWSWHVCKLLSSARHQIMGCLESTRSQNQESYRAMSTLNHLGQHRYSLQWVNSTTDSAGIPLKHFGRLGLKLSTLQKWTLREKRAYTDIILSALEGLLNAFTSTMFFWLC